MASPRSSLPPPSPPLRIGDEVERYQIRDIIGDSYTSIVYKVQHQVLGTEMALKVLKSGHRRNRRWLMAEARAQARLAHPNIVAVTDVLDVNGEPGLVMELVDGPNLAQLLEGTRPRIPLAVQLFTSIVKAVRHAHEQGMVHRDLKATNVLLGRSEGGWVVKVADFGLVKAFDNPNRIEEGFTVGTPHYMAPEQILDADGVDKRADLWALGVIFYELCTGRRPFEGDDVDTVFRTVQQGSYVSARRVDPTLPPEVDEIISALLQRNPDKRIAGCNELLIRLYDAGFSVDVSDSWRTSTRPRFVPTTGRTTMVAVKRKWRRLRDRVPPVAWVAFAVSVVATIGWVVGFWLGAP